jgi:hypothetical protein
MYMNKLLKAVLFGICIFASNYLQAQEAPTVVAFYNLENFYDTLNDETINDEDFLPSGAYAYTGKIYYEKAHKLASVVSLLGVNKNPDGFAILGVAEIENETVLQTLINEPELRQRNLKIVHYNSPDARGIDVGMIYNPKYFKVLSSEAIFVNLPTDENGSGKERTRDILFVTGKLKGELVHVFVNHWPSRRGGEAASAPKRKFAAGVCRKYIDSLRKENPMAKVILMGDLNDDPINESMTKVLNCKAKIKDVDARSMYNPFVAFYRKGLGTMAYQDAWGLFDQIVMTSGFVKGGTGLQYLEAEVFNRPFMVEKFGNFKNYPKRSFSGNTWNEGYSDHWPTMIFLK